MEVPEDRSWIIFNLRPEARWHDGVPITADDVVWSFETLITKGLSYFRYYYGSVQEVEKLADQRVKFTFDQAENRELPLIIGQMPILPRHYWKHGILRKQHWNLRWAAVLIESPISKLGAISFGNA